MATTGRIVYHGDDETIKKEAREFSLTDEIMELINSGGGGGAINGVKVNGQVVNPDQAGYVGLTIPGVINNLSSNSTTDALSAKQGKVLYEYIQALQHVGHFLALWNTATGLPVTNPETSPYTYNTGDYYIVSNVAAAGGTNYKPNGSSYTINVASTTVESGEVQVNDLYFYDGYERRLLDNSGGGSSIAVDSSLSTTSTNPVQNAVITNRLNQMALDANTKTFWLTNLQDTTTGQAIRDWVDGGGNAIVYYSGMPYYMTAKSATRITLYSKFTGTQNSPSNQSTGFTEQLMWIDNNNNTITITNTAVGLGAPYLATNQNYATAYTPLYDGSPATKKYVDDKFAAVPVYTAGSNIDITSNQISTVRNGYVYVTCTDGAFVKNKTGTSAEGNYTPTEGDLVMIHFTQGCSVGGPDISIDGGTAIPFYIGVEGANAGNMYFGSNNVSKMFIYTDGKLVGDAVKDNNTTYSAGTGLSLSNGVFSNTQPGPTVSDTAPSNPSEGAMWYDTDNDVLKIYNGSSWDVAGGGATDLVAGDGIIISPIGSDLPSGYTQLAYIQLDGTQALRTNITGVGSTVEIDLQCSSTAANVQEICAWDEDYLGTFFGIYGDAFAVQNSTAGKISGVNVMNRNTISGVFSRNTYPQVSITVGGDTVSYTRTSNRNDNYLCVGGAISTLNQVLNGFSGYIFSVKIYNTSTSDLIANYVPCRDDNSLNVGLYDTVSGTFNTATVGSFAAGPAIPVGGLEISAIPYVGGTDIEVVLGEAKRLPTGYTEVEYVQSDGNCYVDTLVNTVGTDYIENHFQKLGNSSTTCAWFGSWEGNDLIRFCIGSYNSQLLGGPCFFGGYNYTSPIGTLNTNKNIIKFYYAGGAYYQTLNDSAPITYSPQNEGTNPSITSYIFARHGANGQSITYDNEGTKIFYHLQKDVNGVNKMELIPCVRDSDDEPGFYDLVNERFLANSGSGTLTAGPEVTYNPANVINYIGEGSNTKTFYLSGTSDLTTAQAVVDWYLDGKNPLIMMNEAVDGPDVYIDKLYKLYSHIIEADEFSLGFNELVIGDNEITENQIYIEGTISNGVYTVTQINDSTYSSDWIPTFNNAPYTPTNDYNPSTKKYVDDKVKGAISSGTTAPSSPVEGQLWYDTTNDVLKSYDGTTWNIVGGGGGVNITNVTVSTAYNTAAKVGTTTAGNYVPAAGDLLLVNFVNGFSTSSAPTLAIDSGTAYNIRVGNTSATSTYFSLGTTSSSNVKVLMYYDGTYYKVWSTQNSTYSSMSQSTASTGTSTSSNLISAKVLNDTIVEKAITLDPSSPLTVTTIWAGTEVQYNNLSSKGPTTAYLCVEE